MWIMKGYFGKGLFLEGFQKWVKEFWSIYINWNLKNCKCKKLRIILRFAGSFLKIVRIENFVRRFNLKETHFYSVKKLRVTLRLAVFLWFDLILKEICILTLKIVGNFAICNFYIWNFLFLKSLQCKFIKKIASNSAIFQIKNWRGFLRYD